MAKRKRLSPAQSTYLADETRVGASGSAQVAEHIAGGPPIAQVANAAATEASLQELSHMVAHARRDGRFVQRLPLEAVDEGYLVRDRIDEDPAEMDALKTSLRTRGQQAPIEVLALEDGERFGLISGWRRLKAISQLRAETGDGRFDTILAVERRPETAAEAYVAMVEENEIRNGLSYYERARIASKTVEQGVYETEKQALNALFVSVSRSKRSKIKSFMSIVSRLDGVLQFPTFLGERLGLALAKALDDEPALADRLARALDAATLSTPAEEGRIIQGVISGSASRRSRTDSDREELRPGLFVDRGQRRITLSGPSVTDDFYRRFLDWCRQQET